MKSWLLCVHYALNTPFMHDIETSLMDIANSFMASVAYIVLLV